MKAIVHDSYGSPDGLKVNEVDKPIPRADEVLIRVCATSVNQSDWIALTGRPYAARLVFGLLRPKHRIPGIAVAGRVEAVGAAVKGFAPGDEVVGEVEGAYAEYVSAPESRIWAKPANLTFEEAAAVPVAAMPALQGLRDKGRVGPGSKIPAAVRAALEPPTGRVSTLANLPVAYGRDATPPAMSAA